MSKVLHRGLILKGFTPDSAINTTLCRRVDNSQTDYNVANTDADVTCKFCLRIIADPLVYAHRTKRQIAA